MRVKDIINRKDYYKRLAQVESSGDPNAEASTSSATGLYQFIDSTWSGLVKEMGLDYTLDDRYDPEKSKKVLDYFTDQNANYLRKKLGREPNEAELYIAHFSGMGTAGKLGSLSADSSINEMFSDDAIKSNEGVFQKNNIKNVKQFYDWAAEKFNVPKEKRLYKSQTEENLTNLQDTNNNPIFAKEQDSLDPNTIVDKSSIERGKLKEPQQQTTDVAQSTETKPQQTASASTNTEETETVEQGATETEEESPWKKRLREKLEKRNALINLISSEGFDLQFVEEDRAKIPPIASMKNGGEVKVSNCGGPNQPPCDEFLRDKLKETQEKSRFKGNTDTLYPELTDEVRKEKKEREEYYNPKIEEGITSGDWRQDLLYENDWIMDVPVIGGIIKDQAKDMASRSGGRNSVGNLESLKEVNYNGSSLGNRQSNAEQKGNSLLEQYFSKDPILPTSPYSPKSDYLEHLPSYSIKSNFNDRLKNDRTTTGNFKSIIDKVAGKDFTKDKEPVYKQYEQKSELSELLDVDLGGHKVGAAWDEEVGLPYISISDAWDFEPGHYSKKYPDNEHMVDEVRQRAKIQSHLMHKAGNPFKVYDRFYFDPETKEYIAEPKTYKSIKGRSPFVLQQASTKIGPRKKTAEESYKGPFNEDNLEDGGPFVLKPATSKMGPVEPPTEDEESFILNPPIPNMGPEAPPVGNKESFIMDPPISSEGPVEPPVNNTVEEVPTLKENPLKGVVKQKGEVSEELQSRADAFLEGKEEPTQLKQEVKKEPLKISEYKTEEEVKKLQRRLQEEGYNLDPSGKFKNEGIDGKIGDVTNNAIKDYNTKIKEQNKKIPDIIKVGDSGSYVEDYQTMLKNKGFYEGDIDGDYGGNTKKAVEKFQKEKGLKVDGVIGEETSTELVLSTDLEKEIKGIDTGFLEQLSKTKYNLEGENKVKSFNNLKQEVKKDQYSTWLPAVTKSAGFQAGYGTEGGNLTEDNFSSDELDFFRQRAITQDGKINKGFSYNETREGTTLEGKQVHQYLDDTSSLVGEKESITSALTLGSASVMEGPDGHVYVYDTYDFNDVKDYPEDSRTPEQVFEDRMDYAKKSGKASTPKELAYAVARANASKEQRKAQIKAHKEGREWKPSIALIDLGKKEDLVKARKAKS